MYTAGALLLALYIAASFKQNKKEEIYAVLAIVDLRGIISCGRLHEAT